MKNYNIAIIGLGYWGTIVTNTVISMGLFNKVYIHDNDISKVRIIKRKFGNKVIEKKFDEIKKDKNISNIFLATPPKINFEILKTINRYKKNILIEKPGMVNLKFFR